MISALHLLWICPLTAVIAVGIMCCLWVNHRNDGPGHDPVGKCGPVGFCPVCGSTETEWDPEKDSCTCMECGWHN